MECPWAPLKERRWQHFNHPLILYRLVNPIGQQILYILAQRMLSVRGITMEQQGSVGTMERASVEED